MATEPAPAAREARGRGWGFIDLAELGGNSGRSYAATALRIVLYPVGAALLLGLVVGIAAIADHRNLAVDPVVGILTQYGLIVVAGAGLIEGVVRSHRRPWRSLIATDQRIDWRRLLIGAGVQWAILFAQLALVHWLTGWPWDFALPAALPVFALGVVLIALQSASEEMVFRGYLTQEIGRVVRSRVLIALAVGVVFGVFHLNAHGPLTVPYFLVVSVFFSLASLRDERLELVIGGHAAMNLFAFSLNAPGLGAAILDLPEGPVPFNWAAIVVQAVDGALFYGLTRLLVRLFCRTAMR